MFGFGTKETETKLKTYPVTITITPPGIRNAADLNGIVQKMIRLRRSIKKAEERLQKGKVQDREQLFFKKAQWEAVLKAYTETLQEQKRALDMLVD